MMINDVQFSKGKERCNNKETMKLNENKIFMENALQI